MTQHRVCLDVCQYNRQKKKLDERVSHHRSRHERSPGDPPLVLVAQSPASGPPHCHDPSDSDRKCYLSAPEYAGLSGWRTTLGSSPSARCSVGTWNSVERSLTPAESNSAAHSEKERHAPESPPAVPTMPKPHGSSTCSLFGCYTRTANVAAWSGESCSGTWG